MLQNQQNISMPKEWFDQLQRLAYSNPGDTCQAVVSDQPAEDAVKDKWNLTSSLQRWMRFSRS